MPCRFVPSRRERPCRLSLAGPRGLAVPESRIEGEKEFGCRSIMNPRSLGV